MRRSLALLLLPLALLASGCGASDTLSIDAVANAADRTTAQGSATFEMSIQVTMPRAAEPLRVFASGAYDRSGERARMTMDMGELLAGFGAPPGAMTMTFLFDGGLLYMKLPAVARAETGASTPWVSVDLARAGGGLGDLSGLTPNPVDQLEILRSLGNVERRGTKDIRGVSTTHFHAEVDVRKALDEGLKSLGGAEMRGMLEEAVAETGLETIPVDVYLDDAGILHRMVLDMRMSASGQTLGIAMTLDLQDFGQTVDIEPPPPAQVTDVTERALRAS